MTKLNPTKLFAVKVPPDAQDLYVDYGHIIYNLGEDPPKEYSDRLPHGNFRFVGLVTKDSIQSFTEKQGNETFDAIIYALLQSNECFLENPYGEDYPNEFCLTEWKKYTLNRLRIEWTEAQSKTSPAWAIIEEL